MTALIHDPFADLTPSQVWAASQRAARAKRMCALAKVDTPIVCKSATSAPKVVVVAEATASPDYGCMWFADLVFTIDALLPSILAPMAPKKFRVDEIQAACAKHYEVKASDMISARRTADLTMPRHVAYYLSKELTGYSMPQIGRSFGGRDHTTILYGVRKIEARRKTDVGLDSDIRSIAASLGGSLA